MPVMCGLPRICSPSAVCVTARVVRTGDFAVIRLFRRRRCPGRRGSPWPTIALGVVLLGASTLATAGPRGPAAGPGDTPVLAGAVVQPVVASVSPSAGLSIGSTPVTITGTGFTGATAVTFNGIAALSYTVDSPTQITAVTPPGAPGPAVVRVAIGTCLSAVSGTTFTYLPMIGMPIATSMTPATGPVAGGTTVTILGFNLSGAMTV